MIAVPGVEAASSDSEAPASDVLTDAPVMLSRAELYCRVNMPEVTPLPTLRLSGMPSATLLGRLIASALSGPRAKPGMPTTTGGRGHDEGGDIVAAGRVAAGGAVERRRRGSPRSRCRRCGR